MLTGSLSAEEFVPNSFKATIEQSYTSEVTGKVKKNQGLIEYWYPGRVRLEIEGKSPSIFVSNVNKAWYYIPPFNKEEGGEVQLLDAKNNFLAQLFDILRKGITTNSYFTAEKENDQDLLIFKDAYKKKWGVLKVALSFKSAAEKGKFSALSKIQIYHDNGKVVDLSILDLTSDVAFMAKRFEFSIPQNAKVTEALSAKGESKEVKASSPQRSKPSSL